MNAQQFADAYPTLNITLDGRIARADAAKLIGVSYGTLMRWHREEQIDLKPVKVAGRVFYDADIVQKVISGEIGLSSKSG